MKISSNFMLQKKQEITFKSGKTTLITDFDFTFSPKSFEDKYLPSDIKCYEDIANPYFKKFRDLQKKLKKFKIYISTGRKQGKGYNECDYIFKNFAKLKKENVPQIKGVISNNGETFFNVLNKEDKIVLEKNEEKNKKRNKIRQELQEKHSGQIIAKDLDAFIAVKKAKEKNDFVIVSGDGTNDRSFLNIYSYIDLPKDTKIPTTIEASENILKTMPNIKKQIIDLPLKIIIMEGDCSKEDYYKYLIKTFPEKYKTGKQAVKIGENPLFDNVEKSINEYKKINKTFSKNFKNNKINKIILGTVLALATLILVITGIIAANKNKQIHKNNLNNMS